MHEFASPVRQVWWPVGVVIQGGCTADDGLTVLREGTLKGAGDRAAAAAATATAAAAAAMADAETPIGSRHCRAGLNDMVAGEAKLFTGFCFLI